MLRCLSQMSLSCELNFTSCWLVAHSEMFMCGFFLWRSFSAFFLSTVAALSSFLHWTICLQSLLKVIFFILSHSVGYGPVLTASSPPSFSWASARLTPASVSYLLSLTPLPAPWETNPELDLLSCLGGHITPCAAVRTRWSHLPPCCPATQVGLHYLPSKLKANK